MIMWSQTLARASRACLRTLSQWIAPDYCASCDAPVQVDELFCARCGPSPAPPELGDSVHGWVGHGWVGGTYAPPLSTAIRRFKFSHRADLAKPLAQLLPWPLPGVDAAQYVVVPVPLHFTRLVERGFNPAGLLAREFCRRVGTPFAPGLLERCRDTPQQSRLSARERRTNVAGAFRARPAACGQRVLLIDDVVTTGSTLEACRQALYAGGVVHVTVLALAAALAS
jgi:ComF family protein